MAEPQKPAPPISNVGGQITVIVSGSVTVTSSDPKIVIVRK